MHSSSLLTLLAVGTALAAPSNRGRPVARVASAISSIALPSSSLPMPDSTLALKYVALGVGTQNYTCSSTPNSMTAPPASVGAVADLFDATPILTQDNGNNMESTLPGLALQMLESMNILPDQLPDPVKMTRIGKHFFAAGLVPSFVLSSATPAAQISAKKAANVPAPSGSCPGGEGEGAVDWLQLVDNGAAFTNSELTGGQVYRVETAGGNPPATCGNDAGDLQVQYAALYFFYGPM